MSRGIIAAGLHFPDLGPEIDALIAPDALAALVAPVVPVVPVVQPAPVAEMWPAGAPSRKSPAYGQRVT